MNVSVPFHQLKQQLESFIHTMPVICLFSGRYDLNVLKPYLLKHFSDNKKPHHQENQPVYLTVQQQIKFCGQSDVPCTCLLLQTILQRLQLHLVQVFSSSPYQWMADLRKLDEPRLPSRNAFHSGLTGQTTTQEEYEDRERAWL